MAEAFRLHRNGMPVAWLRDAARQHSAQVDWAGLETEIRRFERHQHDPDYREEQQGQGEGKEEEGEQRRDVDEEDEEGK